MGELVVVVGGDVHGVGGVVDDDVEHGAACHVLLLVNGQTAVTVLHVLPHLAWVHPTMPHHLVAPLELLLLVSHFIVVESIELVVLEEGGLLDECLVWLGEEVVLFDIGLARRPHFRQVPLQELTPHCFLLLVPHCLLHLPLIAAVLYLLIVGSGELLGSAGLDGVFLETVHVLHVRLLLLLLRLSILLPVAHLPTSHQLLTRTTFLTVLDGIVACVSSDEAVEGESVNWLRHTLATGALPFLLGRGLTCLETG